MISKAVARNIVRISVIAIGGLIVLFGLAAVLIPLLFEDEIHDAVKVQINRQVNAQVDYQDVNLSILTHFPYLSVGLEQLEVAGTGPFQEDTLLKVGSFELAANVWSVFGGKDIEIKKLFLEKPQIHAIVTRSGQANWDIMKPDTAQPPQPDTARPMNFRITEYEISEANIIYDDRQGDMFARVNNLYHGGSGNFVNEVVNLNTTTRADQVFLEMGDVTYLNDIELKADAGLKLNLPESEYSFLDNVIQINDLKLAFDGYVQMVEEAIQMDLDFKTAESKFKNIYSLIPGAYTEDYEDLETRGELNLSGFVKGKYTDDTYPSFNVDLGVQDGFVQYPDLPTPLQNIQLAMKVKNTTADINNTIIDIQDFHVDFGEQPVDGRFKLAGLEKMRFDTDVEAKLDLEKMLRIFPIEDYVMQGKLNLDVRAQGLLSEASIPVMDGMLDLKYGYFKSKAYPAAMENLTISASAKNETGKPEDTRLRVSNFHADIDKEPINAKLLVENLEDPSYDLQVDGQINLAKILKIYPIEDTQLSGLLKADINTQGTLSAIENENYADLPTSGTLQVQDLSYKSPDVSQGVAIKQADLKFNPKSIILQHYEGKLGNSDVRLQGHLDNYMGYALRGDSLTGQMRLQSQRFNVNEWLSDEEAPEEEEASLVAPEVPRNISFRFDAKIRELLYDNLTLNNLNGTVLVQNGEVRLQDTRFRTLGGSFDMGMSYATKKNRNPSASFQLAIDSLDIPMTAKKMEMMGKLAPVAKYAQGRFNTELAFATELDAHLNPLYSTMSGKGDLMAYNVVVSNFPALEKISSVTRLNKLREMKLDAVAIDFQIRNGRVYVKPFELNYGKYTMNIDGSHGLDQSMNYNITTNAPAGQVGEQATNAIANLTGQQFDAPRNIKFDIKLGGTVKNPKVTGFKPGMAGQQDTRQAMVDKAKETAKDKAQQQLKEQTGTSMEELRDKRRRMRQKAEEEAEQAKDKARQKAEQAKEKAKEKAQDKAQEAKDRAKEKAKDKAEEAKEKAKDKLPWN